MAFQPVANTVQVQFVHQGTLDLLGASAVWSMYGRFPAAPTVANIQAIVDQAVTETAANYLPLLSSQWRLERIAGRSLHVQGGPSYERVNIGPGTRAGAPNPPQIALVVRFKAASGGASARGRVYLPIGVEFDTSGNVWDAAFLTTVTNLFIPFVENTMNGDPTCDHVVVSRFLGTTDVVRKKPVPRVGGGITTLVANKDLVAMVASQRERRP